VAHRFDDYEDEFGFVAPLPAVAGPRVIPPEGFPTGPALGEVLPDFTLPAADGRTIRLHEDRGQSKAVVTFLRSAVW
jgi:hypothetical protein